MPDIDPTKKDPHGGNGQSRPVDLKKPEDVIAVLRQNASALLSNVADESVSLGDLSKCVALLMLVQAQGIENGMQRIRPAVSVPRIPNLKM